MGPDKMHFSAFRATTEQSLAMTEMTPLITTSASFYIKFVFMQQNRWEANTLLGFITAFTKLFSVRGYPPAQLFLSRHETLLLLTRSDVSQDGKNRGCVGDSWETEAGATWTEACVAGAG